MKTLLATTLWLAVSTAFAEVLSITIGIDVNSPYGISEPWVTIREGLLRLEYVESVSPLPDRKTASGEMRTKLGRVPNVEALATALRGTGAGASLRGVEATVHGHVIKRDGQFLLKLSKTGELLALARVTQRVQFNAPPISGEEQNAFTHLTLHWNGEPIEARITGPLLTSRAAPATTSLQTLEVRIYDLTGSVRNQTNN